MGSELSPIPGFIAVLLRSSFDSSYVTQIAKKWNHVLTNGLDSARHEAPIVTIVPLEDMACQKTA